MCLLGARHPSQQFRPVKSCPASEWPSLSPLQNPSFEHGLHANSHGERLGDSVHCRTALLLPYATAIVVPVMPRLGRARRVPVRISGMRMLVQRWVCLYLCMHEIVIDVIS